MTESELRCPTCAAQVRPGADWCTLCYTDLRPTPVAELVTEVVLAPDAAGEAAEPGGPSAPAAPEPVSADPLPATTPARGRHARHAAPSTVRDEGSTEGAPRVAAAEVEAAEREADAMLAILAAESRTSFGRVSRLLDSRGSRAGVIIGGLVAFSLLLFALMTVLGSLL